MTTRLVRLLSAAVLGLAVVAVPAGAVTASPVAPEPRAAVEAVGGVDDFTFASFDAQYTLGRDDQQRSTLRTTETLVAVFPDFDQNRGIRRAIPAVFQGHGTDIQILAVEDETGRDRPYETETDGDFLVLTIAVPEGQFVYGEQTYVITYTQRDVTAYYEDTDDDEFYWDTNGTGWAQPFAEVSATLTLADGLADELVSTACYFGPEGSTSQCEASATGDTVTARVQDLNPYSNMTIVAAFPPGTFAPAPFTSWIPLPVLFGLGLMLLAVIAALVVRFTVLRDARATGIVVAQYEPQADISPLLAANLLGKTRKGMAAAIVDLAVRRKIRIIEKPEEGFFARGTTFGVQSIDESGLGPDDQKVMTALFSMLTRGYLRSIMSRGNPPGLIMIGQPEAGTGAPAESPQASGEVRWLTKKDTTLGQRVVGITKAVAADALRRKLRRKPPAMPIVLIALMLLGGFLLLLFGGFGAAGDLAIVLSVFGAIIASWIGVGALIMLGARRPLTPEGALAVEHLKGLREYIQLAEADRLQMLQSVSGAERVALDRTGADAGSVVRIYEQLLPYAVLFGLEKEWAGELAKYYDETPPDWYSGGNVSAFNVGVFAGAIGSLSSSVSSSYSGSASSSSSGGSGGGGSSGGGGGGGGGGGV